MPRSDIKRRDSGAERSKMALREMSLFVLLTGVIWVITCRRIRWVGYVARTVFWLLKIRKSFDNMSVHIRTMDTHILFTKTVSRGHSRGVTKEWDSGKLTAAADRRAYREDAS